MNTLAMGYRIENGEIVVDAREMRIMRIIEDEYRAGKGQHDIARTLNAEGLTNRNDKPFTAQMVNHHLNKIKEAEHD